MVVVVVVVIGATLVMVTFACWNNGPVEDSDSAVFFALAPVHAKMAARATISFAPIFTEEK